VHAENPIGRRSARDAARERVRQRAGRRRPSLRGPEHAFEFAETAATFELVGDRPLTGRPMRTALPELAGQGIYELLESGVYASGEPYVGRSVRRRASTARPVRSKRSSTSSINRCSDGRPARDGGSRSVAFDVTELTNARAGGPSRRNRAKDEFLAMLGHELRNSAGRRF